MVGLRRSVAAGPDVVAGRDGGPASRRPAPPPVPRPSRLTRRRSPARECHSHSHGSVAHSGSEPVPSGVPRADASRVIRPITSNVASVVEAQAGAPRAAPALGLRRRRAPSARGRGLAPGAVSWNVNEAPAEFRRARRAVSRWRPVAPALRRQRDAARVVRSSPRPPRPRPRLRRTPPRLEVGDGDDPAPDRELEQLHAVVEAELLHDVRPVVVDRLLGQVEHLRDLAVRVADGGEEQDLLLALGEASRTRPRAARPGCAARRCSPSGSRSTGDT